MNDLHDLVDRATATADWDLDRLVAGATANGRGRLRRRRAGAALATCAALGVVGTGVTMLDQGGGATRAVDPAAHRAASVTPTPTPTPTSDPGLMRWRLAVTAREVPATFASIVPGAITVLPQKEYLDDSPIVDFRWNGYAVRVGLTPDDYVDGRRITDPVVRCRQSSSGNPCVPGQVPGSYESTMTYTPTGGDETATYQAVSVSFAQGWDVLVTELNAATKDGRSLTPEVPLTLDQLREVAYSGAWFLQGR